MTWLFLALLAPAIDTIIIFIDKYVVEHKVKDSLSMPIYSGIAASLFATIVWLMFGAPTTSGHNSLLLLASGFVSIFAYALYFKALLKDNASYVNILLQTTPIYILVMSATLLDQPLSAVQLIGFFIILSSVIGLSINKTGLEFRLNSSFYQILLANLFFAAAAILVAFTHEVNDLVPIMAFSSWGLLLGALVLLVLSARIRSSFLRSFRAVGRSTLAVIMANESLTAVSQGVAFLAITLGPVALVGVLNGTQVFYGILLGVLLTFLFPKIFHEETAKRDIAFKITLSLILFAGIWCIGS